jgi:WD40 repeat protein
MRPLVAIVFFEVAFCELASGQITPPRGPELVLQSGHGAMITKMAFSRDGKTLVSEGFEGALKVWDIPSSAMRREIRTQLARISEGGPGAWFVSDKGNYILAQNSIRSIADKIDVATGKPGNGYSAALDDKDFSTVTALAESEDGKWHVVANSSGFVIAYGPDNHASLIQQKGPSARDLTINPRMDELFVRYADGSSVLWALGRGPHATWPDLKLSEFSQAAFDRDNNVLVLERVKDGFELLNLTKGEARKYACNCWQTTLSGDGSRVAWLEEENDNYTHLRVAFTTTLEIVATLPPPRYTMRMASNWNGTTFAFGDLYGDVSVESEADPVVRPLSGAITAPAALVWSDDSTLRILTSQGGMVDWSQRAATTESVFKSSNAQMTALSENGQALAIASLDGLFVRPAGSAKFEHTPLKIVDPQEQNQIVALAIDNAADTVAWAITEREEIGLKQLDEWTRRLSSKKKDQDKGDGKDQAPPDFGHPVTTIFRATRANQWTPEIVCSVKGLPVAAFLDSELVTANCAGDPHVAGSIAAGAAGAGMVVIARDNAAEIHTRNETFSMETGVWVPVTAAISPDGHYSAVVRISQIAILDLHNHQRISLWKPVNELSDSSFATAASGPKVAVSNDGLVYLMNGRGVIELYKIGGAFLGSLIPNGDHWLVTDPAGRFDTDQIENLDSMVRWRISDDPSRVLPLEIFMRDYFTPRLFSRLTSGETLSPLPDLTTLNRTQPDVRITNIEQDISHAGRAIVHVSVVGRTEQTAHGPMTSGAKDLRVFRDGRLVAFVPGTLDQKEYVLDNIRLPFAATEQHLEFSAYALNRDQVKSRTDRVILNVSAPRTRPRHTFILNIGVNWSEAEGCSLDYAAADARALSSNLQAAFQDVGPVPISLISLDAEHKSATREDIRKALAYFARVATPDDIFVMTYSGHGYTAPDGKFYLLPSDWKGSCAGAKIDHETLLSAISTDDLAEWLRPLDAGEMAMILDACYSAASVESGGFKPGPMGSQGLGQLAYDKRVRILTASQSTQAAAENQWLGMGLLSFALAKEGLAAHQADFRPHDGSIWLREWLTYGVQRVPELYEALQDGDSEVFRNAARGVEIPGRPEAYGHPELQTPVLFDFVLTDRNGPLLWKAAN